MCLVSFLVIIGRYRLFSVIGVFPGLVKIV